MKRSTQPLPSGSRTKADPAWRLETMLAGEARQQLQIFAPQQPQHRALLALGRHAPAPLRRWPVVASVMGARRRASAPYRRVRHAHLLALLH
jgi:hypothetical protein